MLAHELLIPITNDKRIDNFEGGGHLNRLIASKQRSFYFKPKVVSIKYGGKKNE